MPERDNQVIAYLDDDEYAQLKEWSRNTGKSMSHLLREAILEYTDRDRTARLEEKVDRALTLLENEQHTRTRDTGTTQPKEPQSVPERARAIAKRCYENHEMPLQGNDLEIAIEDIAGGDERTLDQYKSQLKKRGSLYEHPMQPIWTDDKRQWVKWVESATVDKDVFEWTSEYGMETTEYNEIADEVEA